MNGPGAGRAVHIRRFEIVVRVSGKATGGAVAVLEHRLPPGVLAMPRHSHAAAEVITVVSGTLDLELDGQVRVLRPGDVAVVSPGVPHTFWVGPDAHDSAVFLAIVAPAGLERYYADVSAAVPRDGKPTMDAVLAAGDRHGVTVDLESLYDLIERHTLQLS